ncbi:MAG: hypothetical protein ABJM19_00365 [Marinobacter sp.]|uniref:hypothetical protein n=1 Tax=Marinobacter sp. TaxID=50741 RepID=UPI0032990E4C
MTINRPTEKDPLEGLDASASHADDLAESLSQELSPLERLKGSVKHYERPTDAVWNDFFNSDEGVSEDFMEDRNQPPEGRE